MTALGSRATTKGISTKGIAVQTGGRCSSALHKYLAHPLPGAGGLLVGFGVVFS
jgi:hypothetical protein